MSSLLDIRDLSVSFRTDEGLVRAVDHVSLSIPRGAVFGLVGESGCGKTVTAMSILRLIPSPPGQVDSGSILFKGQDLLRLPIAELRRLRGRAISVIFQEPMTALSPLHRIGDQLAETLHVHESISAAAARDTARDWLGKVGIPDPIDCLQAYPFQLSGGMRQRVMIAMALMLQPELIIADEPTTALDVTIQAQILDLLREMKRQDTSVLLITHDMGVIWEMCDHMAVMYASEVVESGTVQDLFRAPQHPYTAALLASVPALGRPRERLTPIPGQVPSPLQYPAGCRFRLRCRHAFDRCTAHPPLYPSTAGASRCFLREAVAPSTPPREGPLPRGQHQSP
ncbi:MAG: ABC transporter ATP-binding protein [Lentisphaerae bacterium]|nr:ABC transporter ATP-binding protein [Lentisphaerota bacterium]